MSIYDIQVKSKNDEFISLKQYEGKVLLIVNTATGCGFTPQYEGLEKLYETYKEQGFEILDFPCNQFAGQAPESDQEITEFCTLNYGVKFPQFKKINVNGEDEDPLYTFLKSEKSGLLGKRIKWNFTKFLVDQNGNVIKRYESVTEPAKIEKDIVSLLASQAAE